MYAPQKQQGNFDESALMMPFEEVFKARATPAQSFYANVPSMGQAMSPPSQPTRRNMSQQINHDLERLGARYFAEGGKVGVNAAGLKKIKDELSILNDQDRARALEALRVSRELIAAQQASANSGPATRTLQSFVERPATPPLQVTPAGYATGGQVADAGAEEDDNPSTMYSRYLALLQVLEDPETSGSEQSAILEQLGELEERLEALGVNLTWGSSDSEESSDDLLT